MSSQPLNFNTPKASRMESGSRRFGKASFGFTLIELMIVVVIIGILAAIAYTIYTNYVRDAQRSDAKAALLQTAQQMEQYFTAHNQYPSSWGTRTSEQGYWKIHIAVTNGGQSYTLTATKTNKGLEDSACSGHMTLDQAGRRQPTDGCW